MDDGLEYETREDFARSFIPAFKQAIKLGEQKLAGENLPENNFLEHIAQLQEEAERMKAEGLKGEY